MARRHVFQGDRELQRFILPEARPTGKRLGVGSYGSVEELIVNGLMCAGKRLHEELLDQGNIGTANITRKYRDECQVMAEMRHPHIVQFLGLCFLEGSTLPVLVMEQLDSSLDDLLEGAPGLPLSLKRSLLADVIRGLLYLHTHRPPVVHRDLSARNVLLTSSLVAKISDLGNARIVNLRPGQLARTLTRIPGTFVYMPPEAFDEGSRYGPRLDIFSFGHLALFTLTQVFPGDLLPSTYPNPENPERIIGRSEVERRSDYIQLLHRQLGEDHPLSRIVYLCLQNAPARRPSAEELLQQLEAVRAQIEGPYGSQLVKVDVVKVGMVKALKEKDKEIERLQQQLEERDGQLQDRDTQLQDRDTQLQDRDTQLQEKDAQIQQKDAQIQQKDAQIQERAAEIQTLRAEVDVRNTQIQQQTTEIQRKEAEIHRLQRELMDQTRARDKSAAVLPHPLQTRPQRELQTPLKLRWRKGRDMLWGMSWYPKTVQLHNNLYVGGGWSPIPSISEHCTILVYDTASDCWSELPEYHCYYFTMTSVHGHLTLVGGLDRRTGSPSNQLGVFDPSSQQWTQPYPPMITPRRFPEVATYNNYLLAAGGEGYGGKLTTVEVLDVGASEQWMSATQLPAPCHLKTSAILHDNWYIITASKQVMYASLPELCTTPQTVTKSATNTTTARWRLLPDARLEHSTAIALRGSLLTVGGSHDNTASTAIHVYELQTNKWTKIGDLPTPRYYCSVTLLSTGELLVSGGQDQQDKLTTLVDIATI